MSDFRIIGRIMRLEQEYDPRQSWLDFVIAVVRSPPERITSFTVPKSIIARHTDLKFFNLPSSDPARRLYVHEKGVEQPGLPFLEEKMVKDTEWSNLTDTGFPGWYKPNGVMPSNLDVSRGDRDINWLMDHCKGRFGIRNRVIYFELDSDYAMACLRFK